MSRLFAGALAGALIWAGAWAQTTDDRAPGAGDEAPAASEEAAETGTEASDDAKETEASAPDPALRAEGLAAWDKIHQVFSHPRCANCHVGEDHIPRWSGPSYGETRAHGMNIHGGESRIGAEYVPCSTCHGKQNVDLPHGPPGSEVWHLPPVEMVWFGRTSSEICAQVQDPERNGDRSLEDIAKHVAEDPLVLWGWSPGPGREPAPFSAEETAEFVRAWAEAGAPCPE